MPHPLTTVIHINYMRRGDVRIDRNTIYGNPFHIGPDGTRTDVLRLYRTYFYNRISIDKSFLAAINELTGKRLACWCAPQACHGDIIAEYLNGAEDR